MTEREAFEKWAQDEFYSGLTSISDTWDETRQTYTEFAHHMAWCAWRACHGGNEQLDELVSHYCTMLDNIGDMPISEEWAEATYRKGVTILQRADHFHYLRNPGKQKVGRDCMKCSRASSDGFPGDRYCSTVCEATPDLKGSMFSPLNGN